MKILMMSLRNNFEYKLVILVRGDLSLSRGKTAVQVAHAAVGCALKSKKTHRTIFSRWFSEGQKKVVLKVDNEGKLLRFQKEAQKLGLVTSLVRDAGLTEIPPETVTALGIGPEKSGKIDKITGTLTLL